MYMHIQDGKTPWNALNAKFCAIGAGSELQMMEGFHDYEMVNNCSVVEQAHEIECIWKEQQLLKSVLPDKFVARQTIAKLTSSWRNFAITLKHKKQEISVENLTASLEEKARAKDTTEKRSKVQPTINIAQRYPQNKNKEKNKPVKKKQAEQD